MATTHTNLTRADVAALAQAVEMAKDWRGAQIGNPDPEPLREFDARISEMRAALAKVRKLQREGARRPVHATTEDLVRALASLDKPPKKPANVVRTAMQSLGYAVLGGRTADLELPNGARIRIRPITSTKAPK